MRLHEEFLRQCLVVKLMNPDVADFIATGEMITIRTDSNAPDRVNHVKQVHPALLSDCNWLPILASVKWTSLEVIKWGDLRVRLFNLRLS